MLKAKQILGLAGLVSGAANLPITYALLYRWPYEGDFVETTQAPLSLEDTINLYREQKQKKPNNTYWIEVRVGLSVKFLYPLEDYGLEEKDITDHFMQHVSYE